MRIDKGTDSSSNFDLFLCTFVLIKRYFVVATSLSICRSKISLHRLLLTAFTIANKAYSDTFYMNAYYAVLGGISVEELDEHESDFLQFVDWEILIHKPEIDTLVERFSAAFGE
ncbi:mitochondrial peripheral inner membrane protein [Mitosporidium daphniae]